MPVRACTVSQVFASFRGRIAVEKSQRSTRRATPQMVNCVGRLNLKTPSLDFRSVVENDCSTTQWKNDSFSVTVYATVSRRVRNPSKTAKGSGASSDSTDMGFRDGSPR